MSVIVTLRMSGDPRKLEEHAAANAEQMRGIADRAQEHGVIAHRFYGSDGGQILVIDEWPDAESFHRFFEQQQDQIGPMMQSAGITSQPEVTVWRKLESHDEVGWQ
jgi:heme-degrading monooxygenase HmoA